MEKGKDFFYVSDSDDEKPTNSEIEALRNNIRDHNNYVLDETKTRNVLIVGRTRSGKSTAIGVLKDPCYEPKQMNIFSETVEPKFQSFSLENKINNCKYTINVIDTPGLKEVKEIGATARSDEVILQTITYCLKNEITKINTLLIFISFELGVTNDDLDAFETFLQKFGHEKITVGVCITRAESKDEKWKKQIENQLTKHAYFSEILKRKNIKLCFMGCIDESACRNNLKDVEKKYKKVYQMREGLLKLLFESDDQVKLIDLPITASIKTQFIADFKNLNGILDYLKSITDFDTSTAQTKIEKFSGIINHFMQHAEYMGLPEFQEAYLKVTARMADIASKMDPKTRNKFLMSQSSGAGGSQSTPMGDEGWAVVGGKKNEPQGGSQSTPMGDAAWATVVGGGGGRSRGGDNRGGGAGAGGRGGGRGDEQSWEEKYT